MGVRHGCASWVCIKLRARVRVTFGFGLGSRKGLRAYTDLGIGLCAQRFTHRFTHKLRLRYTLR